MYRGKQLSVVIPSHNEATSIAGVIGDVPDAVRHAGSCRPGVKSDFHYILRPKFPVRRAGDAQPIARQRYNSDLDTQS